MTANQELLGKILKNRINSSISAGTISTDKDNLINILDTFVAGDKITLEQYNELTQIILSATIQQ